jgi:hypothetical protein
MSYNVLETYCPGTESRSAEYQLNNKLTNSDDAFWKCKPEWVNDLVFLITYYRMATDKIVKVTSIISGSRPATREESNAAGRRGQHPRVWFLEKSHLVEETDLSPSDFRGRQGVKLISI